MVAYFRVQNNIFMAAGAVLGLAAAVFCFPAWIKPNAGYASAFVVGLAVFVGVVIGRVLSSRWASRKLGSLLAILYEKEEPETFIRQFSPIVEKTPPGTAEYIDGTRHLAYAYEAMGDFDKGLELMNCLHPENLKLHTLVCSALVTNQRLRLYLLKEDKEQAEELLEELKLLQETAKKRAPAVGKSLSQCIRLAEVWLECLAGNTENISYIKEEVSLAKNWIHKNEMCSLLEKAAVRN